MFKLEPNNGAGLHGLVL